MRGFSTPGSANLNVEGGARGRGGGTEGGAPIHQRPSTLAFPPLSFFSTVRAPSFRVTSALFHPSFHPASDQPSSSRLQPASNPGPVARLLIAVSKFISAALVGGLPEFSRAEGVIRARQKGRSGFFGRLELCFAESGFGVGDADYRPRLIPGLG